MFVVPRLDVFRRYDWVCGGCGWAWPKDHSVCGKCCKRLRTTYGNTSLLNKTYLQHREEHQRQQALKYEPILNRIRELILHGGSDKLLPAHILSIEEPICNANDLAVNPNVHGTILHIAIHCARFNVAQQIIENIPKLIFIPHVDLTLKPTLAAPSSVLDFLSMQPVFCNVQIIETKNEIEYCHSHQRACGGGGHRVNDPALQLTASFHCLCDFAKDWKTVVLEIDQYWLREIYRTLVVYGRRSPRSGFHANRLPTVLLMSILRFIQIPKKGPPPPIKETAVVRLPVAGTEPAAERDRVVGLLERRKSEQKRVQEETDKKLEPLILTDLIPCEYAGCHQHIAFDAYEKHLAEHVGGVTATSNNPSFDSLSVASYNGLTWHRPSKYSKRKGKKKKKTTTTTTTTLTTKTTTTTTVHTPNAIITTRVTNPQLFPGDDESSSSEDDDLRGWGSSLFGNDDRRRSVFEDSVDKDLSGRFWRRKRYQSSILSVGRNDLARLPPSVVSSAHEQPLTSDSAPALAPEPEQPLELDLFAKYQNNMNSTAAATIPATTASLISISASAASTASTASTAEKDEKDEKDEKKREVDSLIPCDYPGCNRMISIAEYESHQTSHTATAARNLPTSNSSVAGSQLSVIRSDTKEDAKFLVPCDHLFCNRLVPIAEYEEHRRSHQQTISSFQQTISSFQPTISSFQPTISSLQPTISSFQQTPSSFLSPNSVRNRLFDLPPVAPPATVAPPEAKAVAPAFVATTSVNASSSSSSTCINCQGLVKSSTICNFCSHCPVCCLCV